MEKRVIMLIFGFLVFALAVLAPPVDLLYAKRRGEDKLVASDGADNDWFGESVSISGDYAIVGAYCDDDNGFNCGSAYMFDRCPHSDLTGTGI